MTFQYASDFHLEFPENYDYLNIFPIQPKADIDFSWRYCNF